MKTTKEKTQFNHNLKPARLALLAVLMLITLVAAVSPAAAQSSPPLDPKSVPTATAEAVPVGEATDGVKPPATNNGYCLYRVHGWSRLTCYWGVINNNSTVTEAISEYSLVPTDRFIGSANMQILNIAPFPGGVTALVYVNWGNDLDVRLDVLSTN